MAMTQKLHTFMLDMATRRNLQQLAKQRDTSATGVVRNLINGAARRVKAAKGRAKAAQ